MAATRRDFPLDDILEPLFSHLFGHAGALRRIQNRVHHLLRGLGWGWFDPGGGKYQR